MKAKEGYNIKFSQVENFIYFKPRNFEEVDREKLEVLRLWDITTSEFLSKIPFRKFEGFEVSLPNFRDIENPYERERERERALDI